MGPIKLRFLMQPAHWSQAERHEKITRETLDHFEKWYGPYPYKTLTVVDPEPDSAAGGMEYPTFITGESSWFMPTGCILAGSSGGARIRTPVLVWHGGDQRI